jgi:hypothetical protein
MFLSAILYVYYEKIQNILYSPITNAQPEFQQQQYDPTEMLDRAITPIKHTEIYYTKISPIYGKKCENEEVENYYLNNVYLVTTFPNAHEDVGWRLNQKEILKN